MSGSKPSQPSVMTYGDHEVIVPPNKLRAAATRVAPGDAVDDPVARAEQALRRLESEFAGWMHEECERLDRARSEVKAQGFTKATREALFHCAHDIKGQAATFGYPWVAPIAESLCRLLEHTPDIGRLPLVLVEQHVDAVRAMVRDSSRPDIAVVAGALDRRLREVTDEFLAHENRDRPDHLDGILAPALAPGEPF
jgi:HPt (histidine-containing phosphotransfer) domain-containing protein